MQQRLTASIPVSFRASLRGICGGQSAIGTCFFFSEYVGLGLSESSTIFIMKATL